MFQAANFGDAIEHMHSTMAAQTADAPCTLHPDAASCQVSHSASLAVYGTPCPPYSGMRQKRRADGSMKHSLYNVTFSESIEWLQKHTPMAAIMEQVLGFGWAESKTCQETPLRRQAGFVSSQ